MNKTFFQHPTRLLYFVFIQPKSSIKRKMYAFILPLFEHSMFNSNRSLCSWFHIKGTLSVHTFNGDYLSIPEGRGSCGYLFHEIPGSSNRIVLEYNNNIIETIYSLSFFKCMHFIMHQVFGQVLLLLFLKSLFVWQGILLLLKLVKWKRFHAERAIKMADHPPPLFLQQKIQNVFLYF